MGDICDAKYLVAASTNAKLEYFAPPPGIRESPGEFRSFMFFPFLPFPACFFLHLSGSGKKQGGTVKGTERRPEEGGRA